MALHPVVVDLQPSLKDRSGGRTMRLLHHVRLVHSRYLQDKLALRAPGGWKAIEHENLVVFLPSRIQDRPPRSPCLSPCHDTSGLWNKAGAGPAGRPTRSEISRIAIG